MAEALGNDPRMRARTQQQRGSGVPIGYALVAAGLASCMLLIPQLPAPLIALVLGLGALVEGAFALWLLVAG